MLIFPFVNVLFCGFLSRWRGHLDANCVSDRVQQEERYILDIDFFFFGEFRRSKMRDKLISIGVK